MSTTSDVRDIIASMAVGARFTTTEIHKMLKIRVPYRKVASSINYIRKNGCIRPTKTWAEAISDGSGVITYEVAKKTSSKIRGNGLYAYNKALPARVKTNKSSFMAIVNQINEKLDRLLSK